jgi:hypothetical protein
LGNKILWTGGVELVRTQGKKEIFRRFPEAGGKKTGQSTAWLRHTARPYWPQQGMDHFASKTPISVEQASAARKSPAINQQ